MIRYYITDRRQRDVLSAAERAIRSGVDMIQVREKDLCSRELLALVLKIRDLAAGSRTRILVNDRVDIAMAAKLDGVHLPANGLPTDRVRQLVKVLGVSTHTIEEAVAAQTAGADFIVFGPVFDTPGKQAVGLEPLRQVAAAVQIPVLAIGGINRKNAADAIAAGAKGIAGIRMFQGRSLA